MALVEQPAIHTSPVPERADSPVPFNWYRLVDEWDFEDRRADYRNMLRALPRDPLAANTSETDRVASASTFLDAKREMWALFDIVRKDATLPPISRPTTAEGSDVDRKCPGLLLVEMWVKNLEEKVLEFARNASSGHSDAHHQRFLSRCKSVLIDLEGLYFSDDKTEIMNMINRMKLVLLRYRDEADPFNSCIICGTAKRTTDFPKRVTPDCNHVVSTCSECLKNWVAASLSENGFAHLKCMECQASLNGDDLRPFADQASFQRCVSYKA